MKLRCRLASALAVGLIHGTSLAQSTPLAAAVDAAWQRSVQAKSAAGQLELAAAQEKAAGALWASSPSVELSHRSDRLRDNLGRSESEAGIAWPLLLPGQRSARQEAAAAERQVAEATLAAAKLRLAGEVREAAWAVVARESEADVARQQAQSLEALSEDVARRVKSGDLARADALAARAEALAASAAAAEAQVKLTAAKSQWKILTGMDRVPDPIEPEAQGDPRHPELELTRLAVQAAQGKLEVVRASRSDPPELTVRYRREIAGSGLPAEGTVGVGIRIPLGTDDRNLPREKAAIAELETARAEAQRQQLRVESETRAALEAVEVARAQLDAESARVELLRERSALIEKSFRAGETALPELLRASAAAAQAQAALAGQRAALGLARARVKQVKGQMP